MDTGAILLRQLRAARAFTVTQADREQVEWWRARISELVDQQPSAEPAPAELAATGAGGGK